MNHLPTLPIGKSSFESIREKNDLYVDKTRHIFELAARGEYYFLSRPRRFGKSLTVSTLKCLFEGRRELFEGCGSRSVRTGNGRNIRWCSSISTGSATTRRRTWSAASRGRWRKRPNSGGVPSDAALIKDRFGELIVSLRRKTGTPVAVLIDEYDKPLIDHIGKGPEEMAIARANRDILKHFFGTLKGGDVADALRFVFVTGVSKFSRVSIFSDLNNLEDLTMVEEHADMLGYTREELEENFGPHIAAMAEKLGISERRDDPGTRRALRRLPFLGAGGPGL
jgi:hypothetical protein